MQYYKQTSWPLFAGIRKNKRHNNQTLTLLFHISQGLRNFIVIQRDQYFLNFLNIPISEITGKEFMLEF